MKHKFLFILLFGCTVAAQAQKITYTEYTLSNGLPVILHQDKSAPVVTVSVMYHVGSKDEVLHRTGFAHFFEHLLFEGSENIKRGEFMNIVASNGGQNNANTTQDRTFYYEVFPSNQLATGLWLESERMMHPVINEIGVSTQNEVVKEEKRLRIDNAPYGSLVSDMFNKLFTNHPYHWPVIGSMQDLDSARLGEFQAFNKKFYVPRNAVLVISGDIDIPKTKTLVQSYFGDIPGGTVTPKVKYIEQPITKEIIDTAYDANIQLPAIMAGYRIPGMTSKETNALEMVSAVLSAGKSSRMYSKMVDDKKEAVQVGSFSYTLEDYGAYLTYAIPNGAVALDTLLADMDEEIIKIQNTLISEKEFQKLQNQAENNYISANTKSLGVAENLANGYTFYKNTNHLNEELEDIRKVTREDIKAVANKYLNKNQRVVLYYLPQTKQVPAAGTK